MLNSHPFLPETHVRARVRVRKGRGPKEKGLQPMTVRMARCLDWKDRSVTDHVYRVISSTAHMPDVRGEDERG
jgi:hypothetical protein